MWRVWMLVPTSIFLVAATVTPPLPPKLVDVLQSPKASGKFVGKSSTSVPIPPSSPHWMLAWNYDTNTVPDWNTNLYFELWHVLDSYQTNTGWMTNDSGSGVRFTNVTTFATNWNFYAAITGALSCTMSATQTLDYFRVRAVDVRSGVASEWNTK